MQDRCMVCVERTIGSESFWKPPIELLGDMRQLESHFVPFGDSGASFFQMHYRLENCFGSRQGSSGSSIRSVWIYCYS
jgi:hypothetical protein